MKFLENIITQGVEHNIVLFDNLACSQFFSRILASYMLDRAFNLYIGNISNFYIPPSVKLCNNYNHICGVRVIVDDGLELDGNIFKFFLSKYGQKWDRDYRLIIAASSKNGLFGRVKI